VFLHIGGDMMVPLDNVITILDLESGDQRERTLETLNYAAWNKEIIYVGKKVIKEVPLSQTRIYFYRLFLCTHLIKDLNIFFVKFSFYIVIL
jgi:hypothetical protein